ncbi:MAG: AAA family ATPase [Thermodesulfobacteriota bacterium]|nr:AAA family ATPase [Thermodesulfobacteriota bacterium]
MNRETDARAMAQKSGMPFVDISDTQPDRRCVDLLKGVFARNYSSIPVRFLNGGVLVAMGGPINKKVVDALSFHMGMKVYPALAEEKDILRVIDRQYPGREKKARSDKGIKEDMSENSHTISIISNKGGVGKTHVSINMARLIAGQDKRVLLIDADLGNADISNKLAMFPENTLYDFLESNIALHDVIMPTVLGFDLIGGSSGEFKLANINYVQRSKFIRNFNKISRGYDATIFDLSAGIGSTVMDFALASDEIVVVTTPQDIIAGYACIKASFQRFKTIEQKLMDKVDDYEPRKTYVPWVIMNQVTDLKQGVFLYNRICQTIDERVNNLEPLFSVRPAYLGGVLYDRTAFRKAEMNRKPITCVYPKSKPAQCLGFISENIMTPPEDREYRQQIKTGFNRFGMVFGLRS